jgi:hypothetical protein
MAGCPAAPQAAARSLRGRAPRGPARPAAPAPGRGARSQPARKRRPQGSLRQPRRAARPPAGPPRSAARYSIAPRGARRPAAPRPAHAPSPIALDLTCPNFAAAPAARVHTLSPGCAPSPVVRAGGAGAAAAMTRLGAPRAAAPLPARRPRRAPPPGARGGGARAAGGRRRGRPVLVPGVSKPFFTPGRLLGRPRATGARRQRRRRPRLERKRAAAAQRRTPRAAPAARPPFFPNAGRLVWRSPRPRRRRRGPHLWWTPHVKSSSPAALPASARAPPVPLPAPTHCIAAAPVQEQPTRPLTQGPGAPSQPETLAIDFDRPRAPRAHALRCAVVCCAVCMCCAPRARRRGGPALGAPRGGARAPAPGGAPPLFSRHGGIAPPFGA